MENQHSHHFYGHNKMQIMFKGSKSKTISVSDSGIQTPTLKHRICCRLHPKKMWGCKSKEVGPNMRIQNTNIFLLVRKDHQAYSCIIMHIQACFCCFSEPRNYHGLIIIFSLIRLTCPQFWPEIHRKFTWLEDVFNVSSWNATNIWNILCHG